MESLLIQDPASRNLPAFNLLPNLFLPASQGGLIEEVRDLITARLASHVKLGIGIQLAQVQQLLTNANQFLGQNKYIIAFTTYRQAYTLLSSQASSTGSGN